MMFVCVCVIGGGVLIMSCNPMRNGPNVWHDTEITKETDICSPKFSQKSVSSLMSTFSKIIFNKLSDSTPPLLTPPLLSPALQHIYPSMLPFPPLTIIIEVHLSEDLIRPLLRRGFILWHLHHRWHHLVDGLIDGGREGEGERQGWVGWGRENRKNKWIQASRDPLRRLSRRELKHNWSEKQSRCSFQDADKHAFLSPHDSLTFVTPDGKSCSLGIFSTNTHAESGYHSIIPQWHRSHVPAG